MSISKSFKALQLAAISAGCLSAGACSTIVKGTTEQVAITTPEMVNATCRLTGGDGVNITVATPGTVHLPKSKRDIAVTCDAAGQPRTSAVLKSTYSDWSIVEHPLGYPVDAVSGAMWVYPTEFAVPSGSPAQRG